jgi:parvulin-like peptidyl-prolyl isomerase
MMKFKWKQTLAALLAAVLMLSVMGCSLNDDETTTATASDASADAADRDQVAVKIGDEYTITKGEIADQYDYMVQMYSYYGMGTPTDEADIESMQDSVISSLVTDKIQLYEAKLLDILLTDDEVADAEAQAEEEMQYYMASFQSQAEDEGAEDIEARTLEIFQEQLDTAEMDMDVEGFRAYLIEQYTNEALKTALKEELTKDITATDEEIQDYYAENLSSQQEDYAETPSYYLNDAEAYQMDGSEPVLYAPEGYVRVRSITISPAEEISDDYTTLQSDLEALSAQYGEAALAALADKYPASTKLNITVSEIEGGEALVSEYVQKKAEADAMYEEYIQEARAKADEAYAALESGTDFTDVLTQYGEDDMYVSYPSFVETGLLMLIDGDDGIWDSELAEAVGLLKEGQYTGIIQIGDMFYILQLVGEEPAGATPLSDVYDAIQAVVTQNNVDDYWNEMLASWENDTSITTYYEDVYRDIGK